MSNELERQLLFKARQGDAMAFEALHLYLNERIRRFVLRLIGDPFQVDDVVQDVFIALYRNLERLDTVERLYPFLFRVARNRCYDILRRQGRYDTIPIWKPSL